MKLSKKIIQLIPKDRGKTGKSQKRWKVVNNKRRLHRKMPQFSNSKM
jgi:hypothetical protein